MIGWKNNKCVGAGVQTARGSSTASAPKDNRIIGLASLAFHRNTLLLYIQFRREKLTAILKKEGELMKYKIILVAAVFRMAVLLKELKNTEE